MDDDDMDTFERDALARDADGYCACDDWDCKDCNPPVYECDICGAARCCCDDEELFL